MPAKTFGNRSFPSRYLAAALAFTSQLIHLWLLPAEFVVRPLSGSLILLVAICQGFLAVSLLFGPGRWMVRFGIFLNAGVVLVWGVTRFFGFPALLGFARLPVDPLNLAATAAEAGLIVLLFGIGREVKALRKERQEGMRW
ncbi:MAG: hypothetical protein ACFB50_05515 [Rubrobacteraceae bacterium]